VNDLFAARLDMALSLAFHILFAAAGIAMPLFMVIAEALWLRTRDPVYLELTRRWLNGTAVLFAVGAVSGTVLSFELGLLWPRFMQWAGPVIGMPFSLEGFAFFMEAIFLGVYLYGWDRVSPRAHLLSGVVVRFGFGAMGLKALLCVWFIAMTSPTAAHAIARAAHRSGVPLADRSVLDRYREDGEARDGAPAGPAAGGGARP